MTRRDALVRVIEALHSEIAALKANDARGLERATADKLSGIDAVAAAGHGPAGTDLRELAEEAHRLNETCRIYVNLMAANTRRRLQGLTGDAFTGHRMSAFA
ncbi:flagellar protein FlgN [Sphingomonas abaci]|uniref:Ribulose-5-phosphate 4-epimerase/fuculose-1-phosphate aldolase n=1 Tax=Sphingomonas abaci TaxID=237611 RepID=A0A7W7AJ99_9SPHN|nr:flagellar protein FlgN [Sphingomonas abaci]MBB4618073.1 ribulose-5-phosphate 4-epimerase/fuculose-1-phosphate aldolase [Sphingomonas abaci]